MSSIVIPVAAPVSAPPERASTTGTAAADSVTTPTTPTTTTSP